MKVAFCIRENYATRIGGDTIQLLRTRERLERTHGVRGDIVTEESQLAEKPYDLCHVFNLQSLSRCIRFIRGARSRGLRVALSTVFWDFSYSRAYESLVRLGYFGISEAGIRWMIRAKTAEARLFNRNSFFGSTYRRTIRDVLRQCDALLPNSDEELGILSCVSGLGLDELRLRSTVVFNAAGDAATAPEGEEADPVPGTEDIGGTYVLEVGRLEPCKNQHALIESLFEEPHIPIVLVGNTEAHPAYFAGVKGLADRRGNVRIFNHQPQEVLRRFYRNAAVHVLPSLRESPGLASLEALSNGCRAVVSERRFCPIDTYFRDSVTTVNPLDVSSIRRGILAEISAVRDPMTARQRIRDTFSWDVAARQTHGAYLRCRSTPGMTP